MTKTNPVPGVVLGCVIQVRNIQVELLVLTANPLKETGPTTSALVFRVRFSAVTV